MHTGRTFVADLGTPKMPRLYNHVSSRPLSDAGKSGLWRSYARVNTSGAAGRSSPYDTLS